MRSKLTEKILSSTPNETKIYVNWVADITVRVNTLIKESGLSIDNLSENQSEIGKWIKGEHDFSLITLAKLQAELGEPIIKTDLVNY